MFLHKLSHSLINFCWLTLSRSRFAVVLPSRTSASVRLKTGSISSGPGSIKKIHVRTCNTLCKGDDGWRCGGRFDDNKWTSLRSLTLWKRWVAGRRYWELLFSGNFRLSSLISNTLYFPSHVVISGPMAIGNVQAQCAHAAGDSIFVFMYIP